jgi:hypothetical protein
LLPRMLAGIPYSACAQGNWTGIPVTCIR